MAFWYGHRALPPGYSCVASIGNFDGVHRGHQRVLRQTAALAEKEALPLAVIIFEPQPKEFFLGATAPMRVLPLREKVYRLLQQGVQDVICLRFRLALAEMSPADFVAQILHSGLQVQQLVIGKDFCFGKGRAGDYSALANWGERYGFIVHTTQTTIAQNERISSSRIRTALQAGRLLEANQLLGQPWLVGGRVIAGKQQGRKLGFPTANVRLSLRSFPLQGVFVARVFHTTGQPSLPALAWSSRIPPAAGERKILEVHLLDFSGDLYHRYLQVELLQQLRDDLSFIARDSLQRQMETDREHARSYFAAAAADECYSTQNDKDH